MKNTELAQRFAKLKTIVGDKIGLQYIKFPPYERRDVVAMIILAELAPSSTQMVYGIVAGTLVLNVDPDELNKNATDSMIKNLIRCGIDYGPIEKLKDDNFYVSLF